MRLVVAALLAATVMGLVLTLVGNPHALPAPRKTAWSQWTLKQKESYVRANLAHARGVVGFVKAHPRFYRGGAARRLLVAHRRLVAKASANLERIEALLHPLPHTIRGIICYVWGDQCSNALAVVQCESNFDIHNQTGQYWGLFQMGEWARANYGFEWDAWQQTRGAHELYKDMGWSPWECAYIVGII